VEIYFYMNTYTTRGNTQRAISHNLQQRSWHCSLEKHYRHFTNTRCNRIFKLKRNLCLFSQGAKRKKYMKHTSLYDRLLGSYNSSKCEFSVCFFDSIKGVNMECKSRFDSRTYVHQTTKISRMGK